ncbi:efflux RND transporter periplasmic adaptor subunit [Halomonas sp. TRM85114]|uniref:efflux RND transporter periplasmic adaptor subunit n=1 Tax=Halomonas jincaotanensis TaxID=2810616 RepID=UPI001BD499B3|nr:efflux RND transporter periplasmic adaptor subunit [Halomonas jincaotanensis]MBS9403263.1 efflux RND transporter periplasmic adaptor subunit [Halomonas jincaotanensis]
MPRRPPLSYLFAAGLMLALLLWLALGDVQQFQTTAPPAAESREEGPTRVEVRHSEAATFQPRLVTQGQLEADRELELRSRRAGRVAELPVALGATVEEGEVLVRLAADDLQAQLARAEADLTLARAELDGAESLRQRQLMSRPEYLRRQASVSTAAAAVAELRTAQDELTPVAPFDGVFDRRDVDIGDVVQVGETFGRLVDDRRLIASAWIAQGEVAALSPGLPVEVELLDGSQLRGEVTHIARRADPATRTFYVEATLDNPERRRLAGASATLTILLDERSVHRLSPALLVLDDEVQLSVKHLDEQDRVVVSPVNLVQADADAARVAGLPDSARLITLGGGLVEAGERVTAVEADTGDEPAEAR